LSVCRDLAEIHISTQLVLGNVALELEFWVPANSLYVNPFLVLDESEHTTARSSQKTVYFVRSSLFIQNYLRTSLADPCIRVKIVFNGLFANAALMGIDFSDSSLNVAIIIRVIELISDISSVCGTFLHSFKSQLFDINPMCFDHHGDTLRGCSVVLHNLTYRIHILCL